MKKLMGAVLMAVALSATGCGATLADLEKSPVTTVAGWVSYVDTFIQIAEGVWNAISPLLGASQSSATATFQGEVATLQHTMVVAQDAAAAYAAGTGPAPDEAALVADLQKGVADIEATIASFQGAGSTTPGGAMSDLAHMAAQIKSWK